MSPQPQSGDVIAVWFSNGAASAVAWRETVRRYGSFCKIVAINNPVIEEDPDNLRFAAEVSDWVGAPLSIWRNPSYPEASAMEVWDRRKAMNFPHGAPCTVHLKKEARQDYLAQNHVDWHVFGFTADERKRHERFVMTELPNVLPVLIEGGITKDDCYTIVSLAGIALPDVYFRGYPNANCIGCVKATSPTYWNLVRRDRPEVFRQRAEQSRRLGVRLARYKGERIFLDELPEHAIGRPLKSMTIECGPVCEEWTPAEMPLTPLETIVMMCVGEI